MSSAIQAWYKKSQRRYGGEGRLDRPPTAVVVVGQLGSGAEWLIEQAHSVLGQGSPPARISRRELELLHPDMDDQLHTQFTPGRLAREIRPAADSLARELLGRVARDRCSAVIELDGLGQADWTEALGRLREAGLSIHLLVLAVPPEISRANVQHLNQSLELAEGAAAALIDEHEAACAALPTVLRRLLQARLHESVTLLAANDEVLLLAAGSEIGHEERVVAAFESHLATSPAPDIASTSLGKPCGLPETACAPPAPPSKLPPPTDRMVTDSANRTFKMRGFEPSSAGKTAAPMASNGSLATTSSPVDDAGPESEGAKRSSKIPAKGFTLKGFAAPTPGTGLAEKRTLSPRTSSPFHSGSGSDSSAHNRQAASSRTPFTTSGFDARAATEPPSSKSAEDRDAPPAQPSAPLASGSSRSNLEPPPSNSLAAPEPGKMNQSVVSTEEPSTFSGGALRPVWHPPDFSQLSSSERRSLERRIKLVKSIGAAAPLKT